MSQVGAMLGPIWGKLGPSWAKLGPSLDQVGRSWGQVGPSLGQVGAKLGLSWSKLGPSWTPIGPSWVTQADIHSYAYQRARKYSNYVQNWRLLSAANVPKLYKNHSFFYGFGIFWLSRGDSKKLVLRVDIRGIWHLCWTILGQDGTKLGPSWDQLRPSWAKLGQVGLKLGQDGQRRARISDKMAENGGQDGKDGPISQQKPQTERK